MLYVLIGMVGLSVFSGFRSGIATLLGPAGEIHNRLHTLRVFLPAARKERKSKVDTSRCREHYMLCFRNGLGQRDFGKNRMNF